MKKIKEEAPPIVTWKDAAEFCVRVFGDDMPAWAPVWALETRPVKKAA